MKLRTILICVLSIILISGCAHAPRGAHGHVRVGGSVGGGVGAVAVGIGIGALITKVLTTPQYHPGHTPTSVPKQAKDIHYHGIQYRYHNGVYYRKLDGSFRVVKPPIGITVRALPPHPDTIVIEGETYYVVEGVYYYRSGDEYVVVEEPKITRTDDASNYVSGQFYRDLPSQAQPVKINGIQYFTYAGIFFLPQPVNGSVRYLVVELN